MVRAQVVVCVLNPVEDEIRGSDVGGIRQEVKLRIACQVFAKQLRPIEGLIVQGILVTLESHIEGHQLRLYQFQLIERRCLIDSTFYGKSCLRFIAQLMLIVCQLLPLILAPALNHHQQVEMMPMQLVVALEIVGRIGNKALQLAGEQEVCQDIAIIIRGAVAIGVVDGKTESGRSLDTIQLHRQLNSFVGRISLIFHNGCRNQRFVVLVIIDEAQAIG